MLKVVDCCVAVGLACKARVYEIKILCLPGDKLSEGLLYGG